MRSRSNSSAELVRAFVDAVLVEGDADAVTRYFDPEVEYIHIAAHSPELKAIMPWLGVHYGVGGVKEVYALFFADVEVLVFAPNVAIDDGEHVAMFGHLRYRARRTGKVVESDWAIHAILRAGRIWRFHFYADDYTLATAFRHGGRWDVENHLERREVPSPGLEFL